MKRIALTDGSGHWFDQDAAVKFKEDTRFDGRNHISRATGSQWDHEFLYYTKSGRWVLNTWSNYQHVGETYAEITEAEATKWLIEQEHADSEEVKKLPESVRQRLTESVAAAEM